MLAPKDCQKPEGAVQNQGSTLLMAGVPCTLPPAEAVGFRAHPQLCPALGEAMHSTHVQTLKDHGSWLRWSTQDLCQIVGGHARCAYSCQALHWC